MDTVDILCRARELYASAPSHAPIMTSPDRGTYCALTAIQRSHPDRFAVGSPAYEALLTAVGINGGLAVWNAEHSTAEVLAAFDRAIAAQRLHVPDLTATGREAVHA